MLLLLMLPKRYSPARLGSTSALLRLSWLSIASTTARPPVWMHTCWNARPKSGTYGRSFFARSSLRATKLAAKSSCSDSGSTSGPSVVMLACVGVCGVCVCVRGVGVGRAGEWGAERVVSLLCSATALLCSHTRARAHTHTHTHTQHTHTHSTHTHTHTHLERLAGDRHQVLAQAHAALALLVLALVHAVVRRVVGRQVGAHDVLQPVLGAPVILVEIFRFFS